MKILPLEITLIPEKRETGGNTDGLREMTNLKCTFNYLRKRAEGVKKNKYFSLTVHCNILYNINQQNAPFLNQYFYFLFLSYIGIFALPVGQQRILCFFQREL
jgi:hypothetical protein